jgi:nucleoside-triphosphatase THEP1
MMISALIASGEFNPQKYGLSVEDCESWQKLWSWCEQYQAETGEAPAPGLVKVHFPDFTYTPNVGCGWAAQQLARDSEIRKLKFALRASLSALQNDDIDEARAALAHVHASRPLGKAGDSIWSLPTAVDDAPRLPVPYAALGRVTGGIGPGELWYLAAPSGAGKTTMLCEYAATLMEHSDLKIDYLSLEVPTRTINKRVRRSLATKDELKLLDAKDGEGRPDHKKIIAAINSQRDRINGHLTVYDPSHGRVTPGTVRRHLDNADLVIIDHVGLMYTQDGRRAIDDWRALATISNCLMEDKLATGTSILAAAQLNKQGMEGDDDRPPKVTTVGGSYQLVMDGDVVITMKRPSEHTLIHGCEKNREGASAVWYSHYDVARARYDQITKDQALEIISRDQELSYT